jgi:hypothetical protein
MTDLFVVRKLRQRQVQRRTQHSVRIMSKLCTCINVSRRKTNVSCKTLTVSDG